MACLGRSASDRREGADPGAATPGGAVLLFAQPARPTISYALRERDSAPAHTTVPGPNFSSTEEFNSVPQSYTASRNCEAERDVLNDTSAVKVEQLLPVFTPALRVVDSRQ